MADFGGYSGGYFGDILGVGLGCRAKRGVPRPREARPMGAFTLAGGGNLLGRGNLPCVGLGLPWFTLAGGGTVVLWVAPDVILGATELPHPAFTLCPKTQFFPP